MNGRVSVVKCDSYAEEEVQTAVSKSISLVGGLNSIIGVGDKVLVKPNLLSAMSPDRHVTTHPSVVKAVVEEVKSVGASPIIGDTPGGPVTRKILDRLYGRTGMTRVAEETGAGLNYDTENMQIAFPEGKLIKRLDVMAVLAEVDHVITLPKMKTHLFTQFTGATKILFGVIPGLAKPAYHLKFHDVMEFSDMLLDLLEYVRPSLSLMDGIVGLEGDGPGASGTPKEAGVILAGRDSVALDVVAASIAGMNPADVPVLKRAIERGMVSGKLSDVGVVGESIDSVKTSFKQPSHRMGLVGRLMSSSLMRKVMLKNMAPYPDSNSKCVRCGVCAQNCPAHAITMGDRARMDLEKCIRCYCCHELCPHSAVDLRNTLIGRMLSRT
ncbi:MAG: DUF362 domain-containing protein [Candidatus Altiarchaeales archaeon]|nr:DUF362 domain-containing protein [Candidatus Altiarchaeales archaeon]MBD3416234.1 DUF362 domain-containing protein [Candidatus Altiarchaeales archaeon]